MTNYFKKEEKKKKKKLQLHKEIFEYLIKDFQNRKFGYWYNGHGTAYGLFQKDGKLYVYEHVGMAYDSYGPCDMHNYIEVELDEVEIIEK